MIEGQRAKGRDASDMDDASVDDNSLVRRQAEAEFRAYKRTALILPFLAELFVFVLVLMVITPALRSGDTRSAVILVLFGWTVGLLIQGFSAFLLRSKRYNRGVWQRALSCQAALARLADSRLDEKPKRQLPLKRKSSDEDELLDIVDDDHTRADQRQG